MSSDWAPQWCGGAISPNPRSPRWAAVSLALGASLWALSALAAPLVAAFFHAPDLRWIIVAMGVTFVTTGIRVHPEVPARRVTSSSAGWPAIDAVEAMTATRTVLTLALLGFRYWALVIGTIAGQRSEHRAWPCAWRRHSHHGGPAHWSRGAPERLSSAVTS